MLHFPPFRLHIAEHTLYRGDARVALMPKPFAVLQYLVEHAGRLVTQDELMTAIWPETYVQPEVLRRYILEIRRALGDQPESPRFIETVPKRGYRFIAAIEPTEAETVAPSAPTKPHTRASFGAVMIPVICLSLAGGFLWSRLQPTHPTGKDTVVLADFANATGDPVFDATLRQGLAVQLEQSPSLRILSDDQIHQTLQLMGRSADTKLSADIGREVCRRTGSNVLLQGSIAQIGTHYSLILTGLNCSTGESLASAEVEAIDKSHVLEAVGKASSNVRKKLGESLATIQKFDTPLVQATTASLEALQVYSLGHHEVVAKGNSLAAIPFLQRAIQIDPNFALAYSTLGSAYWNIGETALATQNIRKAFELRGGLSAWEKLRIEAEYPSLVTNNLEKARRAYEVWEQTYPADWAPKNRLGVLHTVLGQHEQALADYESALRLYPESGLIRANLIGTYLALGRLREAHSIMNETSAKGLDISGLRIYVYRFAFLERDFKTMEQQLILAAGNQGLEGELLADEAGSAAYFGHLESARRLTDRAAASAERGEGKEAAAGFQADAAVREALFGNGAAARERAQSALRLSSASDVQYRAALAMALGGDDGLARKLEGDLEQRFPEDTIVEFIYIPVLRAQLLLRRNETDKALDALQPALPYEQGGALYPAYLRALALLASHRPREAQIEVEKIRKHPGVVFNAPIGALASVQSARACAMQKDAPCARAAYQEFFKLWSTADPAIPVLQEARAEFAMIHQ